ncbi:ubiquitin thiolesterase [Pseudoloma neurophilia]|uniref:Ubiquitin thiolesterase n=1 Tax=Pseudoloma neurophilia TaxID=146866 RepID=A0A0R0LSA7_9MICR|nr:ubiquitin thiolesterase [Pseudoloma neurophilia]
MVKRDIKIIPRPCKLINTRNTCFFNSAIQLTIFVHPLTTFFYSAIFTKNQQICQSFQNFLKNYSQNTVLDPQSFINILSQKINIFNGEEQDAQEFLLLFYNNLAIELGFLDDMKIDNLENLKKISKKNIMINIFYGLIKNNVKYYDCNHISSLTHQFWNLTLPVTESIQQSINEILKINSEKVKMKCDECKINSKVKVKTEFLALPKILIIQLSRFFSDRKNDNLCIINERLVIDEYAYHPIGFICHTGTLQNGHYTAYAKVLSKWHLFDDTSVKEIEFENCNKRGAYIIFYSRV